MRVILGLQLTKNSLDEVESNEIEKTSVKRSRFKFDWFSGKGEEDLLFEDVSLKKDSKKTSRATEIKKSKEKDSMDSSQDVQQQSSVP